MINHSRPHLLFGGREYFGYLKYIPMNKGIPKYLSTLLIALAGFTFVSCNQADKREFWSPWEQINWTAVGHYDAEFHTHPGLGDEQYDPHQTIDRYHQEGYRILTIAAHDYDIPSDYINTLYPWSELSSIFEIIKDLENPTEDNKTYAQMANEPYQDRNPVELGMVSVEGCEISAPHHVVSLFNPLSQGAATEEETFQRIAELGGIAYFAHPGRYLARKSYDLQWYLQMYRNFDILIGQSVYNRKDNHPGDRAFFDEVAHNLGANRPIWLFGEDDMHYETTLGWNRNVVLIENFQPGSLHPDLPDGSAPDVKHTLINGLFYLWKPAEQYTPRAFNITDFRLDKNTLTLTIDQETLVEHILWKSFDPQLKETVVLAQGPSIAMSQVPIHTRFVRAEISGQQGTLYTQPFYILNQPRSQ